MDGRFEVREMLGAGGMGRVHRAFDRTRQEVVALKSLRRSGASDIQRLKREFRSLTDLSHPNLVTLHELFSSDDGWFFTMELVDGQDFVDHVRGRTRRPTTTASTREVIAPTMPVDAWADSIVASSVAQGAGVPRDDDRLRAALRQLLAGLIALHGTGRVHGDVKPSNVLVTPNQRVVVLDFGLVADLDRRPPARASTTLVGTPPYMAPEQLAGMPATDAADWYAVGVMLFEALAGRLPFEGPTAKVVVEKQLRDPPRITEVAPAVPGDLARLCDGFLARDPARRMSGREALALLGGEHGAEITGLGGTRALPGRDDALAALRDAYLDARRGQNVAVVVQGASGVGKTALLRAFVAELPPDVIVLQGRCYERESVPFKGIDEVVDALAAALATMPEAGAHLPADLQPLVRIFPALARAEVLDITGDLTLGAPGDLRARAFAAFRELVGRLAATRGVVIAIDDAQWGDADGAALLAELVSAPGAPAALVIVSCRPEDRASSPLVGALGDARELRLGPLSLEHARELTAMLLEGRGLDGEVVERVARASSGHPLFLCELARHLRTRAGAPAADLAGMVRERVERLPPSARRMLELVAIAGRPVREHVVRAASGLSDADAPAVLATLRAEHLLRVRRHGVECHHDYVRVAVIAALDEASRRAHHLRLAEVLAERDAAEPEALVEHLRAAGLADRAARHAVGAAERAGRALAFDRAAGYYDLAVAHGAASPEVWERLGDARMVLGRHVGAGDAYREAQRASAPPGVRVRRLRKQAAVAQQLGAYAEALVVCRQALALVDDPADLGAASVEALAALTCCYAGDLDHGMQWADRAAARLAHSSVRGPERWGVEAALHRARGNLLLGLGRAETAAAEYLRGIAPCEALDDRWERSIALFNVGEASFEAGDLGSALHYLELARVEKSKLGDRWGLGYTWLVLARVYGASGDLERARACARTGSVFSLDVAEPRLVAMLAATMAAL